jgi:hypothetical protein
MTDNPYALPGAKLGDTIAGSGRLIRFLVVALASAVGAAALLLGFFSLFGTGLDHSMFIGLAVLVAPISAIFAGFSCIFMRIPTAIVVLCGVMLTLVCTFAIAYTMGPSG